MLCAKYRNTVLRQKIYVKKAKLTVAFNDNELELDTENGVTS